MIIEGLAFKFRFFTIITKIRPMKGCLVLTAMIMVLFIVGCSRCSAPKVQPKQEAWQTDYTAFVAALDKCLASNEWIIAPMGFMY
ncbi:MAG: hypothetical protein NTY07_07795, partial [Bacteroidia bacterium]|nr:hypothetical protein [Bacteroidia bacterium]